MLQNLASPARLLSGPEQQLTLDAPIADVDHLTYGDLSVLARGHESDRQIAARVVWLDRESLDFMPTIYAARDRIMHLACRVATLEAQARSEWVCVEDRVPEIPLGKG